MEFQPTLVCKDGLEKEEEDLEYGNVGFDSGKPRKRVKGPGNSEVDQCVSKWFKNKLLIKEFLK